MRTFGFIGKRPKPLHEVQIPETRLARMNASLKRRLDDDVEEVFHRACATNDLESASDLLALLEKWHTRRAAHFGRERRISGANLQRARKELGRLETLHGENTATTEAPADESASPQSAAE